MNPDSFWNATVREAILMVRGYDERELAEYRRIRLLRYDQYCLNTKESDRVSMEEWMPLDGDPTPEEMEEIKQEMDRQKEAEYYNAIAYYEQHGVNIFNGGKHT